MATTAQPPRPPNSWILFRSYMMKRLPPTGPNEPRRSQAEASAMISDMWRNVTPEMRAKFEQMAEDLKQEHKRQYPDYKYQPKKKAEKEKDKEVQRQQRIAQKRDQRSIRGVERVNFPYPPFLIPMFGPAGPAMLPMPESGDGLSPPMAAAVSPPSSEPDISAAPATEWLTFPNIQAILTNTEPLPQLPYPIQPPGGDAALHTPSTSSSGDFLPIPTPASEPGAPLPWQTPVVAFNTEWPSTLDPALQELLASSSAGFFEISQPVGDALASDQLEVLLGNIERDDVNNFLQSSFAEPNTSSFTMQGSAEDAFDMSQYCVGFDFPDAPTDMNEAAKILSEPMVTINVEHLPGPSTTTSMTSTTNVTSPPTFDNSVDIQTSAPPSSFNSTAGDSPTTPYVPPSGASLSSTRRVAGNWSSFFRDTTPGPRRLSA